MNVAAKLIRNDGFIIAVPCSVWSRYQNQSLMNFPSSIFQSKKATSVDVWLDFISLSLLFHRIAEFFHFFSRFSSVNVDSDWVGVGCPFTVCPFRGKE